MPETILKTVIFDLDGVLVETSPRDRYPGMLELFAELKAAGISIVLGAASTNVVGASPAECIVVADAAAGINVALDGGFVAVGMGNFASLCHAHLFVNSLCELNAERLTALHARWRADHWTVTREGIHPQREGSLDTLYCIGNGRIGVRGHLAELPVGTQPGTLVAGFYDKLERPEQQVETWSPFMHYWGDPALAQGLQIETCIINCPDFLAMDWTIDGERIDFTTGTLHALTRRLDLRCGMYVAEALWESPSGKSLRFTMRRFAHAAHTNRVYVQYSLEPLNFSGQLQMCARIDTTTVNNAEGQFPDVRQQALYTLEETVVVDAQSVAVRVRGAADGMNAAFATGLRLPNRTDVDFRVTGDGNTAEVTAAVDLVRDSLCYVDRVSCFALQSREPEVLAAVQREVRDALGEPFNTARIASTARWHSYWDTSDVIIDGDVDDQIGIRFSIYNLLIAGARDDSHVSIAAKSLTGEMYRGMVFWDTDIHMLPFFIFTQPEVARNLALFRYHTLHGARAKAAKCGFRGANYPWVTGVSGFEDTEKWLKLGSHQAHITSDIAYALQQYVDCTGDLAFYEEYAAEILIETARFWVSKAVDNGAGLSIPDAGGPDEFHVVSDDSAYVNQLARLNLRLADRAVRHLRTHDPAKLDALCARIGAEPEELDGFAAAAERILPMQTESGLFEQCRGFFALRDEMVSEHVGPQHTQTVKQADVLMFLYLLPDQWSSEVLKVNWDYYEPRTIHASSLSHAVHGILAAELGLFDKAETYMRRSLGMDLHDEMGNARVGAHMAANGMNWSAMVRGFGGVRPQQEHILVAPRLPARWQRLAFTLKWRGAEFVVDITQQEVTVTNKPTAAQSLLVVVYEQAFVLAPGAHVSAPVQVVV